MQKIMKYLFLIIGSLLAIVIAILLQGMCYAFAYKIISHYFNSWGAGIFAFFGVAPILTFSLVFIFGIPVIPVYLFKFQSVSTFICFLVYLLFSAWAFYSGKSRFDELFNTLSSLYQIITVLLLFGKSLFNRKQN